MSHTDRTLDGLRRAHSAFLETGAVPRWMRSVVAQSWLRSAAAGVDAETNLAPVGLGRDDLETYRSTHQLSLVFPLLYDVLGRAAEDCEAVMAVGDAQGQLLWVCGRPAMLREAERIHFAEGAIWDEVHAGTNAPGTALRLDAAVQIHAGEHFNRLVQPWSCAAAPIHDPQTGAILGIVDVTGGEPIASPQTLGMVRAAARMAEAELARIAAVEASRTQAEAARQSVSFGWSPTSPTSPASPAGPASPTPSAPASNAHRSRVQLRALGRLEADVSVDGASAQLSPRHSEILVLLAEHPEGMTGDQLAVQVYASQTHSSTMRAEMTRLRALLGREVLQSRPYRLLAEAGADWRTVKAHLSAGRVREALALYDGPLLPQSDAPGIVELRESLERQLRASILSAGQPELMVAWTRSRWGADDLQMWQRQAESLPPNSPLRPIALAEAERLECELAAPV
ncbi:helix-turn-helix domain-containing protein [Jatrophihabitans sp. GAS493]|uniref:helix-turn-helix domain-containing protein n=1 Tax=Jatrophihabitans sp. GAS493 TaxID=1907575 RepID=UPI000BB73D52|nr:helix-turn-helix domain-containing protein [Jatrophihabitans sp. GAS493]